MNIMIPGDLDVAVAEEAADGLDADALHDEVAGELIAQIVDRDLWNPCSSAGALQADQELIGARSVPFAEDVP